MSGRAVRRALVLAYHFPPQGGGGVQRSLKFVRYLAELGYEPVVVTGPPTAGGRWTPADETLATELPPDVRVVRARGPQPVERPMRARASRWTGAETEFGRWWTKAGLAAARRAGEVDIVYASLSPWESAVVAARIAAELDVPWVADLRDPWALDEMTVYPTALHRRAAVRAMRRALTGAAAIVMNVPEARDALLSRFPELGDRPVVTIPNGYDAADFAAPAPPAVAGPLRIVHTGFLHTAGGLRERRAAPLRRALGGSLAGVDILGRSHLNLMAAVERLLAEDPSIADRLEVHLAGDMSQADRAACEDCPVVRIHGYLPHLETVGLMRSADLLFLPMHGLTPGRRARIVPGKTYEYLAARRPILATVPDGDARDLLAGNPHARLCRPGDVEGLAALLAAELDRPRPAPPGPQPPAVLERRALTALLADTFDRALGVANGPNKLVSAASNPTPLYGSTGIGSFTEVWASPGRSTSMTGTTHTTRAIAAPAR